MKRAEHIEFENYQNPLNLRNVVKDVEKEERK